MLDSSEGQAPGRSHDGKSLRNRQHQAPSDQCSQWDGGHQQDVLDNVKGSVAQEISKREGLRGTLVSDEAAKDVTERAFRAVEQSLARIAEKTIAARGADERQATAR